MKILASHLVIYDNREFLIFPKSFRGDIMSGANCYYDLSLFLLTGCPGGRLSGKTSPPVRSFGSRLYLKPEEEVSYERIADLMSKHYTVKHHG